MWSHTFTLKGQSAPPLPSGRNSEQIRATREEQPRISAPEVFKDAPGNRYMHLSACDREGNVGPDTSPMSPHGWSDRGFQDKLTAVPYTARDVNG